MAGGREQRKKMLKDHTVTDWHAGFIGRFGTGGDEVCCCFYTFTERNAGEQLCGDDGRENVTGSRPGTSAYRNTAAVRCAMFGIKRKINKKVTIPDAGDHDLGRTKRAQTLPQREARKKNIPSHKTVCRSESRLPSDSG